MNNCSPKLYAGNIRRNLADKLEMVVCIAGILDGETDECFQQALELIVRTISCDAATLYLIKADTVDMEEIASVGGRVEPSDYGSDPDIVAEQPDWVDQPEQPLLLTKSDTEKNVEQDSGYALVLRVPLIMHERLFGVLNLGYNHPVPPTVEDVRLATIIARLLMPASERFLFRQEVACKSPSQPDLSVDKERNLFDITVLQNLTESAELAVAINHKLNNSLSVIIGNVQCLLLEKAAINQKTLDRFGRIESAAIMIGMASQRLLRIHWLATKGCQQPDNER